MMFAIKDDDRERVLAVLQHWSLLDSLTPNQTIQNVQELLDQLIAAVQLRPEAEDLEGHSPRAREAISDLDESIRVLAGTLVMSFTDEEWVRNQRRKIAEAARAVQVDAMDLAMVHGAYMGRKPGGALGGENP